MSNVNLRTINWLKLKINLARLLENHTNVIYSLSVHDLDNYIKGIQKDILENILQSQKPRKCDKKSKVYAPVLRSDGSLTSSTGETITTILQHHFPVRAYKNEIYTEELATTSFHELSSLEIERALAKIKSRKAPGIDKIPGEIVKEIYAANKEWFVLLFNMLLRNGRFPSPWKIAEVVLIPKVRKKLNMPSHYRPICLLSTWGKLYDRIIVDRLIYHLEMANYFSPNQFGFRRKKSTFSAIENIKRYVSQADGEGQVTCLISLDIANAFNSVSFTLLMRRPVLAASEASRTLLRSAQRKRGEKDPVAFPIPILFDQRRRLHRSPYFYFQSVLLCFNWRGVPARIIFCD
ncbi:putative 115 kDa protein in type-1 retrotransposable element R1DM [Caerostris darwini]|uniref:115 kDa protein in type-1 retrotransposable element R1DM n=1 Tax=Caerostris darwini TaxID=1538125 RepID=A0AAV4UAY6_9ARAC|nr:putative 115 kDa protein in type-1 retrotransposable element R1DM [Caerostris darwini]